jgi:hypothetical protein
MSFADENARIAWEVGQAIDRISQNFPSEGPHLKAHRISFDPEHAAAGTYAIMLSGTVIGTAKLGVFIVPERTLTILQTLRIPYRTEEYTK